MAVLYEKLLKVFSVADIQPRIGGDETERAFGIEEGKSVKIEIDVEVAFGVELVGDSSGGVVRFDILLAFVAEEVRKGLIHRSGKLCFVGFLVIRSNAFAREFWVGDVLLPDVRRIADDDIETAVLIGEYFNEGDVPDKGQSSRISECVPDLIETLTFFSEGFKLLSPFYCVKV